MPCSCCTNAGPPHGSLCSWVTKFSRKFILNKVIKLLLDLHWVPTQYECAYLWWNFNDEPKPCHRTAYKYDKFYVSPWIIGGRPWALTINDESWYCHKYHYWMTKDIIIDHTRSSLCHPHVTGTTDRAGKIKRFRFPGTFSTSSVTGLNDAQYLEDQTFVYRCLEYL